MPGVEPNGIEHQIARYVGAQTLEYLMNSKIVAPAKREDDTLLWYVTKQDRIVFVLEPTAVRNYSAFANPRTAQTLRTVLQNRRVALTAQRGFFIQVGYYPDPSEDLAPHALDLSRQPSPLHLPIGTYFRGQMWLALDQMQATLIGGSSGTGKTNELNCFIQALLNGKVAQLVLYDGKGGMKYARYGSLPRVQVVTGALLPVLGGLVNEMQARFETMREAGASDFKDFNAHCEPGARMTPIALVIDELATALGEDSLDDELVRILNRGREAGIYPILATQHASAKIVSNAIKVNCITRIAFAVPAAENSRVILDHTGAERLPAEPPGRLLITRGARIEEVHAFLAPEFSPVMTPALVTSDLSDDDVMLLQTAVEKAGGWFKAEQIGYLIGRNKNAVNSVAQRLQRQGYLTAVQTEPGTGRKIGRQVTEKTLAVLGDRVGFGVKAEQAD